VTRGLDFEVTHGLTDRQREMLLAGGLTAWLRSKWARQEAAVPAS
jgi:hypothetical protein